VVVLLLRDLVVVLVVVVLVVDIVDVVVGTVVVVVLEVVVDVVVVVGRADVDVVDFSLFLFLFTLLVGFERRPFLNLFPVSLLM